MHPFVIWMGDVAYFTFMLCVTIVSAAIILLIAAYFFGFIYDVISDTVRRKVVHVQSRRIARKERSEGARAGNHDRGRHRRPGGYYGVGRASYPEGISSSRGLSEGLETIRAARDNGRSETRVEVLYSDSSVNRRHVLGDSDGQPNRVSEGSVGDSVVRDF